MPRAWNCGGVAAYKRAMSRTALICIAGLVVTAASCKKKEDQGDRKPAATADAAAAGKPADAAPAAAEERPLRVFDCKFAGITGEGEKREVQFDVTNRGEKKSKSAQSWIYYYDEANKQTARYPHRFFVELDPGASEKTALGFKGTKIPEKAKTIECEITAVEWDDGSEWQNENLVYNQFAPRPLGGESPEALRAREGEKVTATWKGEGRKLTLKNESGRPLTAMVTWSYYYDAAGKLLGRDVSNLRSDLEAGASADIEPGKKGEPLPDKTAHVEATVSQVKFRDGDREEWHNRNLELTDRPMAAAVKAASK